MARQTFPYMSSETYLSPSDKTALEHLARIPLLPQIVRKYNEIAGDRLWYARNSAESVRCGENQFQTIHRLLQEGCGILGVTEPEIYLQYGPSHSAFTAGMHRTFIVLRSALVDDFTDDELLFIIGHELGHIHCAHLLYQSIGYNLIPLLDALGQYTLNLGKIASTGLVAAFYEWLRQAEYSADRAGLLVCQDPNVALSAIMKLGSGAGRLSSEMNLEAFLDQARHHSEALGAEGIAKTFLFFMYNWHLTHPQVVFRAKHLDEWIKSGAYDRILTGDYIRDASGGASQLGPQVQCQVCKLMVSANTAFCPGCGYNLRTKANTDTGRSAVVCQSCGVKQPATVKFCMECGTAMGSSARTAPPPAPAPDSPPEAAGAE